MIVFPPAKINIGLQILRKRDDGYHDLELSFLKVPFLHDVLEISHAENDEFLCEGIPVGRKEDNLVCKAWDAIRGSSGNKSAAIRLHLLKNIPTGSGLGGGSSDAAYTLKAINAFSHIGLTDKDLTRIATQLGSDCAFFLQEHACIGYGRGEELEVWQPCHRKNLYLVIIVPNVPISTADAYRGCLPMDGRPHLASLLQEDISLWKELIENDFEKTLFPRFPILNQIKKSLYNAGAVYASLSGSGSALFGLFIHEPEINLLKNLPEGCLIKEGYIAIP